MIFKQEQKAPRRVTFSRFVRIKEIEKEDDDDELVYIGEYNKLHLKGKTHMYLSIFTNWYSKKSKV